MKISVGLSLLVGAALALLSSSAEAQSFHVVPVPTAVGTNYIGSSGSFPIVLNDTTCTFNPLNPGFLSGALRQNTEVRGASDQKNNIWVVSAPTGVCGATLTPILLGQFKLDVVGGNAGNSVANFGLHQVRVLGGTHVDIVINKGISTGMFGDAGNDFLYGGGANSTVNAWSGIDIVCSAPGSSFVTAFGGADRDTFYGTSTFAPQQFEEFGATCPLIF